MSGRAVSQNRFRADHWQGADQGRRALSGLLSENEIVGGKIADLHAPAPKPDLIAAVADENIDAVLGNAELAPI